MANACDVGPRSITSSSVIDRPVRKTNRPATKGKRQASRTTSRPKGKTADAKKSDERNRGKGKGKEKSRNRESRDVDFAEDAEGEDDHKDQQDPELAEACEATADFSESDEAWGYVALSDGSAYKGGAQGS